MSETHKPSLLERLSALLMREPEDREQLIALLHSAYERELLDAEARATLTKLLPQLEAASDWQVSALEAAVRGFAEAAGQKLGKIAQPLRAALTGRTVSPPVFDVMAALGREEALARIRDQAA